MCNLLKFQFDISWQLLEYHLPGIDDKECMWKPGTKGLHVHKVNGIWRADWPDTESYDIGPASIAWVTWHIIFWWSMVLDYSYGEGTLTREEVQWPGNIEEVREKIINLRHQWKNILEKLTEEDLLSCKRTIWPFEEKPFYELAAWLNLELMKNASEIGYCRFLYATRDDCEAITNNL